MSKKSNSPRTDWHKAIFCAVQIDLKEYADLLEYKRELSQPFAILENSLNI